MDTLAAFAPRDAVDDLAGTVSYGDGLTFDVGEALEDGGGLIVVARNSTLEYALKGYGVLESVKVPEGAEPVNPKDVEGAVKASDSAKTKAAELGVDLTTVDGSGKGGSITVKDVEKAASADDSAEAAEQEGAE